MSAEPPLTAAGNAGMSSLAAGSSGAPAVVVPDAQPMVDAGPSMDAMPVMPMVMEDDAGEWMPPDPVCVDGVWKLAPGFLLSRRVEYVADRETPIVDGMVQNVTILWSEAGMACASAKERERCLERTKFSGGIGRHLITTAGDTVSLWDRGAAIKLLGVIDTPAEALWWTFAQSVYLLPCDVRWEASKEGYHIRGALSTTCGPTRNASHRPLELLVQPGGTFNDYGPINANDPICAP